MVLQFRISICGGNYGHSGRDVECISNIETALKERPRVKGKPLQVSNLWRLVEVTGNGDISQKHCMKSEGKKGQRSKSRMR